MLLNAFSLNMIQSFPVSINTEELSVGEAADILRQRGLVSAVGHANTAAVFSSELGLEVPVNRATVSLNRGDWAVVGQYSGPRLDEGATELPEGAAIKWIYVQVLRPAVLFAAAPPDCSEKGFRRPSAHGTCGVNVPDLGAPAERIFTGAGQSRG